MQEPTSFFATSTSLLAALVLGGCSVGETDSAGASPGHTPESLLGGAVPTEGDGSGGTQGGAESPAAVTGSASLHRVGCGAPTVAYEVFSLRRADGSAIDDPQCEWTFDDGTTSDRCIGEIQLDATGDIGASVLITDPATGGTSGIEAVPTRVFEPLEVELDTSATQCGLSIDYQLVTIGGSTGAHAVIEASPAELVVDQSPDPIEGGLYEQVRSGIITVARPGSYELSAHVEDEASTGPICTESVTRTVTVAPCP